MAMAGGWLFAQMCDLCVAAEHASFAITEARVGRGTPWAAPLLHMLPQRIMMELLLTGEPMSATRLYELGYVNHVVPARAVARAQPRARHAHRRQCAPHRERLPRAGVCGHGKLAVRRRCAPVIGCSSPVYLSEDAQEGPRAFAEKRPPVWKGK